jgi:hypothetical protein
MPKVTYHPSQFDVPAGSYRARFLGTEERPPFEGPSKWGPATQEPRLRWKFEVLDGPCAGKFITQDTNSTLTGPKSGFARMLKGLLGRMPTDGEVIDTDTFVHQSFQLEVEVNPNSESGNLYVAFLKPIPSSSMAPPPRPGNGQTPPAAPPGAGTGRPACDPAEPWIYWDAAFDGGKGREQPCTRGELFDLIKNDSRVLDGYVKRPGTPQWLKVSSTDLQIPF